MSALVRAGAAATAAPRILAARHALPPMSSAVAKARRTEQGGEGGDGGRAGGGGGAPSSSSSSAPLDLDALLSDKGAVESMRAAIRGAMAASRSAFEGNGSAGAAAAAVATGGGGPKRSSSRERGSGGERGGGSGRDRDNDNDDNNNGRRPASSDRDRDRGPARGERNDRDRSDRGPARGERNDRDRSDRGPARGDRDRGERGPARGGGRGDRDRGFDRGGGPRRGGGRDDGDNAEPTAAALRLSRTFRLDLQSTALGRAAASRLLNSSSPPVFVAVLHPTKTRLFDEHEAAAPSLLPTLASAAARDAAAPAAAGASPMVFGGAVAFVARLGEDGRCSADVAVGGASMPSSGKRGAAASKRAVSPQGRKGAGDDGGGFGGWPGPEAGDPVLVVTPDGRALAWGAYNGASMFRVRVLQTEAEALADEAGGDGGAAASSLSAVALDVPRLLERRVREAADLRRALGLSVGPQSNAAPAKKRRASAASKSAAGAAGDNAATAPTTDVFRLVNGEGDRLSGLVADQMGPNVVVVQSNAAWVERHREDVENALRAALLAPAAAAAEEQPPDGAAAAPRRRRTTTAKAAAEEQNQEVRVIWRRAERMLREEGVPLAVAADTEDEEAEGEEESGGEPASAAPPIVAREAGLLFAVAPERGQKTGFYADQRDNRAFVARLVAAGAAGSSTNSTPNDVLDVCCYSGGFALAAARAGASRVDAVDSSLAALELARENARLNGVGVFPPSTSDEEEEGVEGNNAEAAAASSSSPAPVLALHRADASAFLSDANARGAQWRVVVLDPPKLAPSRRDLERALRKYWHLNAAALRAVRPGGFLITHSCSGAVARSPALLQAVVCSAAASAGRQITLVREGGAAADHPLHAAYPEGRYLTSLCFRVL